MSNRKDVLVICRSPHGRMYLGVLLNRLWYKPVLAKSAEEALRLSPHAALSGIVLDGDNVEQGPEAGVSLLKTGSPFKHLPVIVLVSDKTPDRSEALLALGCSAVISKPLDISFFFGILARLSGQPRQAQRIPVRMRVQIEEQAPENELTSVNISESGIYLRTLTPLPEGTVLHITFTLPRDVESISVAGEVVRAMPLGEEFETDPGMGLRFIGIPGKALQQIRNFVQWEMTGDLEWEASL